MEHGDMTRQIIGSAYKVYNTLSFGFLESVYERCMVIELQKSGLKVQTQAPIRVFYGGQTVGEFFADLFVEDCVIVELKSVRRIVRAHEVQLVNYLSATNTDTGLLLNFGPQKVEVRRRSRILSREINIQSDASPIP